MEAPLSLDFFRQSNPNTEKGAFLFLSILFSYKNFTLAVTKLMYLFLKVSNANHYITV
jgi:hypothetical protein